MESRSGDNNNQDKNAPSSPSPPLRSSLVDQKRGVRSGAGLDITSAQVHIKADNDWIKITLPKPLRPFGGIVTRTLYLPISTPTIFSLPTTPHHRTLPSRSSARLSSTNGYIQRRFNDCCSRIKDFLHVCLAISVDWVCFRSVLLLVYFEVISLFSRRLLLTLLWGIINPVNNTSYWDRVCQLRLVLHPRRLIFRGLVALDPASLQSRVQ